MIIWIPFDHFLILFFLEDQQLQYLKTHPQCFVVWAFAFEASNLGFPHSLNYLNHSFLMVKKAFSLWEGGLVVSLLSYPE